MTHSANSKTNVLRWHVPAMFCAAVMWSIGDDVHGSCPVMLTQSNQPDVIEHGGIACTNPNAQTSSTAMARSWDAGTLPYSLCEVTFGVQSADFVTEVIINIYQGEISEPFSNLLLIGTETVVVPETMKEFFTATFDPPLTIPDDQPVVIEVFVQNIKPDHASLIIGTNSLGETAPTYVRAPECDVSEFVPVFHIGPNIQLVMTVAGAHKPGDLNGDGVVDGQDLLILLGQWGPCSGCPGDLNGDGVVDGADLLILLANWG